ncbi:MAG: hypothetical protein FD120_2793 [Gammaproteobacteria bacterium]|nr:MAG: hypothetical protein FD120_2793 [Gammaproteobacteria bacterium]
MFSTGGCCWNPLRAAAAAAVRGGGCVLGAARRCSPGWLVVELTVCVATTRGPVLLAIVTKPTGCMLFTVFGPVVLAATPRVTVVAVARVPPLVNTGLARDAVLGVRCTPAVSGLILDADVTARAYE